MRSSQTPRMEPNDRLTGGAPLRPRHAIAPSHARSFAPATGSITRRGEAMISSCYFNEDKSNTSRCSQKVFQTAMPCDRCTRRPSATAVDAKINNMSGTDVVVAAAIMNTTTTTLQHQRYDQKLIEKSSVSIQQAAQQTTIRKIFRGGLHRIINESLRRFKF